MMSRTKIDYGIDLGTTNSAISRMEQGNAVVKKTDIQTDTLPSCTYINKKKVIRVGQTAYNELRSRRLRAMADFSSEDMNVFSEFKRTMGTDKTYYSSYMEKNFSSEELSAEVLKTLKSFISDENISSIVITIPAKFTSNQKDATQRAALEYAGFKQCELLQEPIAASMAYGMSQESKDGYWLVFDFGGGTFDAALVKVDEGIMKVIDTEGDNYLGGKNLDYAIVDEIIIPWFEENHSIDSIMDDDNKRLMFREAMKNYAEETKIRMSFSDTYNILADLGDVPGEDDEGEEFELDITVTQEMVRNALEPIFQQAIDLCIKLLERNGLSGSSLNTLLLVGGPTYSPILRQMLKDQIAEPNISVDPMTVVARGAALYASTINISDQIRDQSRDRTKIQLGFGYEPTTVETNEIVAVKILTDKMSGPMQGKVLVDLVRGDEAWSSGKMEVDAIGEVFDVSLLEGKANSFKALVYDANGDLLPSEPSGFTIIQGAKIGSATLPYSCGVEIKNRATGKVGFTGIKGLEKNSSTPATGTRNGLKTQQVIRPGLKEDFIKIPLYEGEHDAENSAAIHNDHIYDIIISGVHLPKLLPAGSDVDLTIKVDQSERKTASIYFPLLDHTEEIDVPTDTKQKDIDEDWLEESIEKTRHTLNFIILEGVYEDTDILDKLESDLDNIERNFNQGRKDYDTKMQTRTNLRKVLKEIEKIQEMSEWPKIEEELKTAFYRLEQTCDRFDNEQAKQLVQQIKRQIPDVIKTKDAKLAQNLIESINSLGFQITDEGLGAQMEVSILHNLNEEFDTLDWHDRRRARTLLDKGLQMAATNPVKEQLRSIVIELYRLLPDTEKPLAGGDTSLLLG